MTMDGGKADMGFSWVSDTVRERAGRGLCPMRDSRNSAVVARRFCPALGLALLPRVPVPVPGFEARGSVRTQSSLLIF